MNNRLRFVSTLFACGALVAGSMCSHAAVFPARAVRLIVGFAPGGSTDASARVVARGLSEKWGQPVVVDNRAGGDSTIAAGMVAHATPDGLTLLWTSNAHTITASQSKQSYDAIRSFAPITLMGYVPNVLLINPSVVSANSARELIALAKSRPGQLNFGSSGTGSPTFLEMLLLMNKAGIDMVNITYKGGGPAVAALLGGETQLMFSTVTTSVGQVKAGKLKALAITGRVRSPLIPDVPTVAEATGLSGFEETGAWNGAMAPAGTPGQVMNLLHKDFVAVIRSSSAQRTLSDMGYITLANSSAEFAQTLNNDISRWSVLLKKLNA